VRGRYLKKDWTLCSFNQTRHALCMKPWRELSCGPDNHWMAKEFGVGGRGGRRGEGGVTQGPVPDVLKNLEGR
jgi:hypothetical protein